MTSPCRIASCCLLFAALVLALCACEKDPPSIFDTMPAEPPTPPPSAAAPAVAPRAEPSSPIEARHSKGDAVRAAATLNALKVGKLELVAPQWDNPAPLTFRNIRTNYDYFQVHKEFIAGGLSILNGAAVVLSGAVMPIEKPPENGALARFWLANPKVVMAGCVFCNPPTLGDLVYVQTKDTPLIVDREELYRGVVVVRLLGRFFIDHQKTKEGVEYLFRLELKQVVE